MFRLFLHPHYRQVLRPIGWLLLLLAGVELAAWWVTADALSWQFAGYTQFHLFLEIFAIIVSWLIFGVFWSINRQDQSLNLMLLAVSSLAVGWFDLLHALSFAGMPDLVSPSGAEKAINFWLMARLVSALGLLAFVFLPTRSIDKLAVRHGLLGLTLFVLATATWIGLWHPDWLPHTFHPESGLTPFKRYAEYLLVVMFAFVALGLLQKMRTLQAFDVASLFAATCILALSEYFFAGYTRVNDAFNALGHVYKIFAYAFIYRYMFNTVVQMPHELLVSSRNELERSHKLLQTIIETIPLRVFWLDRKARYQGCNTAFAHDVGLTDAQAVIGRRVTELPQPDLPGLMLQTDLQVMASAEAQLAVDLHLPGKGLDGDERWLRASTLPLRNGGDAVVGVLGIFDDITERKRVEQFQQLTAAVFESTGEAIIVTDGSNHVVMINPTFTALTGYSADEVQGRDAAMMHINESGNPDFFAQMASTLQQTNQWRGEMWCRHKNGELMVIYNSVSVIRDAQDAITLYVGSFSDVSLRKKSEELIWRQANFDMLTLLPNRNMLYDRLGQEMKKAVRTQAQVALLLLDLDLFKEVNDSLGHDAGDQLLKEAASRITACVREIDTVARLGGDEFSVVLGGLTDRAVVERIAEDILKCLAESFYLSGEQCYISASIGITCFPEDAQDLDGLLRNADQAMYAAKRAGRNRYSYFTNSLQEVAQKRMRLINELRGAVDRGEFRLHYQPIIEMASGRIFKAEALIRWQHPQRGLIGPGEFIALAEDTGLIVAIGDWVFEEAVRQVSVWRKDFQVDFQISVNKSPVQFRQESGGWSWIEHLQAMGVAGDGVVVEITEGLLMDAHVGVQQHLLEFRDAGIQVALDDFGTGYSSLSYLKKFDIDYLKIDQTFVRNLAQDPEDRVLCEAIIVMAHKLGIKVIAEGIETPQQRDILAGMGCDFAQGYLFSRPVPVENFEHLLMSACPGSATVLELTPPRRG